MRDEKEERKKQARSCTFCTKKFYNCPEIKSFFFSPCFHVPMSKTTAIKILRGGNSCWRGGDPSPPPPLCMKAKKYLSLRSSSKFFLVLSVLKQLQQRWSLILPTRYQELMRAEGPKERPTAVLSVQLSARYVQIRQTAKIIRNA